jgi:hypothetical protein
MQVPVAGRSRWRHPIIISLAVHLVLAVVAWQAPKYFPKSDTDDFQPMPVNDREIDVHDMDIFEPVEVCRPGVVQMAAAPATAAPVPSVDPPTPSPSQLPAQASGAGRPAASDPGQAHDPSSAGVPDGTNLGGPLFPVAATSRSVVYVIDRSGSMGERGRLTLARRELEASLRRLPESVRFQVIVYNRRPEALRIAGQTGLVPATFENVSQATRLLREIIPEGGTEHLPALRQALFLRPDLIYFLTDADDLNPVDVQALTQLNQGHTAIHAVELTLANRDRADMPMHRLARDNRGAYRAVEPPALISSAVSKR